MGGQNLLLDAADGENLSPQRDLSRHGDFLADGGSRENGRQRRRQGDACRRAVLRDGALRDVDVDVVFPMKVRVDAQLLGPGTNVTQRRLRRLLHHVAQLSGEGQFAAALHERGLGHEDLAADFRPGQAGGDAHLALLGPLLVRHARTEARNAQKVGQLLGGDDVLEPLPFLDDAPGQLPADGGELALQVPDARLAGVIFNDVADALVLEADVLHREAVGLELLLDEELFRDVDLLVEGVPGQPQHLHPVFEGRRDGVQDVRGRDEHDLGEIELGVQVVVEEGDVLLRIKDLQQRRGGVAPEIHAHLVDLVQQEDGVLFARLAHHLDDLAREGADVGPTVAADLRFVAHATQGEPDEFPAGRPGDALGQGGLADTRRADEAEDGSLLHVPHEAAHGEEFQNPLLDLLQAIVIVVENLLRPVDVPVLAVLLVPRHRQEPFQVVPRDGRLGGDGRHDLEALELLNGLLVGLLRHLRGFDLLLELLDFVAAIVLASQLLLDRLHLLVEVVLLLRLLHLLLDPMVDAAVHPQLLDLPLQELHEHDQALLRVERFQQVLLLLDSHLKMGRDGVGQSAGFRDADGGDHGLVGQVRAQLDVLFEEGDGLPHLHLDLGCQLRPDVDGFQGRSEVAVRFPNLQHLPPADALHQQLDVPVGELEALDDVHHRADVIDLIRLRFVRPRVALRGEEQLLVRREGRLHGQQGGLPPHDERNHRVGEDHHVPERDEREPLDLVARARQDRLRHLYPAFCIRMMGATLFSTTSRVMTHSVMLFWEGS